jgi:hypothetical protein
MFRQAKPQMSTDIEKWAARAAPAIFVVLWSTGFVATKYVLHNAEPLIYLAIRMAVVVALMAVIVVVARPPWPDRSGIGHSGARAQGSRTHTKASGIDPEAFAKCQINRVSASTSWPSFSSLKPSWPIS